MKIAISGLSGVGSSSTAKAVAQRLNLEMYNFTFRNLAEEYGVHWLELQERALTDPSIDLTLDRRLIEFGQAHSDCLISTDFACWLDDPGIYEKVGLDRGVEYDLKIWLEASLDERAKRMQERKESPLEQIKADEHKRDEQNRERLRKLYGLNLADRSKIDWELNTEELSLESVVEAIVERAELIRSKK
jgi:cytidylate kinase